MKYVVIDTETTGLDYKKNEVIAFGAMVMIDGVITETLEIYCHPERINDASPKALEVNGYSRKNKLWRYAIRREDAIEQIIYFLRRHIDGTLVGHNVQFDIQFLINMAMTENDKLEIVFPKPYLDTRDVARATLAPYGLDSMSLDSICSFLGWKRRQAHTALSDCEDCIRLLRALCPPSRRFLLRLKTLNAIRKIKGVIQS